MPRDLRAALRAADDAPEIRVILIRGRGASFCAGGDLRLLESGRPWSELAAVAAESFAYVAQSRQVTIAVVHGWAVGGGFELLLACDLAIAAQNARIGDFHIRNGLYAGGGSIHRLARTIGLRRTRELVSSGDTLSGSEARDWGLVNEVAQENELEELAEGFASRFAVNSPSVTMLTKIAIGRALEADSATLTVLDRLVGGVVAQTADAREGIAAFRERRPPGWAALPPRGDARET